MAKSARPNPLERLPKVWYNLGIFLCIGIIAACIIGCVLTVYIFKYIADEPVVDLNAAQMSYTTILYGENDSGGTEEMERIHGDVNRIWVDYDQIPQDLVDAAVALEDKRFWTHAGVDWRRTIASAVNLVIPIYEGTPGGSTITQQVVKNITQDNDFSIARKAKEITRQKNSIENATLVGKLSSCTGKKPELNELFIVEGDSAGGSAKQARERSFQAILPLKGKPLNAEKKRIDQVLANDEIRTIISALGTGIGEDFDISNLKYYKVIILSDADQDGAHIRAILLTFFYRYMKELISEGHVYIGLPPLYKVAKKDAVVYAYDDKALEESKQKLGRGCTIQRYKGLGEMNPEQLWETTIDPKRRTLLQVTIEDAAEAETLISTLMGDNVEARKAYLSEWADFNKDDSFADVVKLD